uniref:Specifically androgen-regulated gene protein n=1 Tax=Amphilophus citrinellus TaxID=61819 RepID=A0A3Q0QRA7_AMPCI
MPKSDTWPGDVPVESFSNMDSAGSSDSVISMNSGYSEDSMEYLSAEERACLTYFEETIEALEVQEDSGLSSDESHHESRAEKIDQMRGNAPPASTALAANGKTQHYALNQTSEPQHSPLIPESSTHCRNHSSVTPTEVSGLTKGEGAHPENVTSTIICPGPSTEASEIDLSLIPPPLDFRDKPDSPSQPDKINSPPPSVGISSKKPGTTFDLEQIRQRASVKKTLTSPVSDGSTSKPRLDLSPIVLTSSQVVASPPAEAAEPKSPPVVAPKPKSLPHNIVLNSHKRANSDGNSEKPFLDPHKVRMEALKKLGLLKSSDDVSGPALSPKLPLKAKTSWTASSPPISPAAPNEPPSTQHCSPLPASVTVQSLTPAAAALPSTTSTALPLQDPDTIAAPAAFSDPIKPSPSENELSFKYVTEATPLTPPAMVRQPTPPKVKSASLGRSDLGGSRYMAGQIFSEASQDISSSQSLSQQHNNRPRPTSLRSRFSSAQGEVSGAGPALTKDPASQKALPASTAFHHSRDGQKLPRSQGISVLICPRSENEEDRRVALKKLGLLRD